MPRPFRLRPWLPAAMALCAALAPGVARADERTEARRHFRAGLDLASRRDFTGAVDEFLEAYRILPNANVLYNIGRAYADSGDAERAIEYFRRYLASDVQDRADVEALVRDLELRRGPTPPTPAVTPTPVAPQTPVATPNPSATGPLTPEQVQRLRDAAQAILSATDGSPEPVAPAVVAHPVAPTTPSAPTGPRDDADTYEERVVTATLTAQSPLDSPNATTVITAQDIRLSGLTSIPELLRRAVGVDVMQLESGEWQVGIRGFNRRLSNRVLVLVDGRSVYLDFLGVTFWPGVPVLTEEIERIEIIRGPGSALYGADAYSGVVNIITRAPGEGRQSVSVSAGNAMQLRGSFVTTGRAGDVSWRAGAGYEQAAAFSRLVGADDTTYRVTAPDPNLAVRGTRFDLDVNLRLGPRTRLRAGIGGTRSMQWFNGIGPLRRFWTEVTFIQPHVQFTSGGFTARAFLNHMESFAELYLQPRGDTSLPNRALQDVFDAEVRYGLNSRFGAFQNSLTLGASYRMKYITWSFLDGDHRLDHFAGYVQDQLRYGTHLSAIASLRVDRHPILDAPVLSPRVALIYKPTERRSFRAAFATAFRTPTLLELYLDLQNPTSVPGVAVRGQGGEVFNDGRQRLSAENALSFDIGYQDQTFERLQLEANVFYQRGTNLIELTNVVFDSLPGQSNPGGAIDAGRFRFANDPNGTGVYGLEAGLRVSPLEGFDLYGNYTFAQTTHDAGASLTGDQRTPQHKLNLGAQIRTRLGLDFEVDGHYASSQVWLEQDLDTDRGVIYQAYQIPDYFLLNARVGYRVPGDHFELGLVGMNLTDSRIQQHPFASQMSARVLATLTARY